MSFSLSQTAITMIDHAGYGGLALGLVVDSAGIPIPSEVLIPLATVSAHEGRFSLVAVILLSILAQVLGGIIAYEIGRRGGLPLLERYGKYILISHRDLQFTHRQFVKRGEILAATGRCLPLIRGYVGFVAGIAAMPFKRFVIATTIGSTVWTLILVGAGLLLADHLDMFDKILHSLTILIALAILAVIAWWARHKLVGRHS